MSYRSISDRFPDATIGSSLGDVGDPVTHHVPETLIGSDYNQIDRLTPGFNWVNTSDGLRISTPNRTLITEEEHARIKNAVIDSGLVIDGVSTWNGGGYVFTDLDRANTLIVSNDGVIIGMYKKEEVVEA